MEKKKFKINFHIVFAILVIATIAIFVSKFWGFGRVITRGDIATIPVPENPEIQAYDNFMPNIMEDDGTFPKDDGVTTVVCLGNNPFSDDMDSEENVCEIFADATGAKVYNCSIPGSYLSAKEYSFFADKYPMDAFSLYWLTTGFCVGNDSIFDDAIEAMEDSGEDVPQELFDSVETLRSIDFEKVDFIYIMYDGSDYFAGRPISNPALGTDIQTFAGATAASIDLIRASYPWIRIIVMSPTYAFGVDENGEYISSDIKKYGQGTLSAYVLDQYQTAYNLHTTFIDNIYGTFYEDIAKDYLTDNLHLNQKGRELVVVRMIEAMENESEIIR